MGDSSKKDSGRKTVYTKNRVIDQENINKSNKSTNRF